MSRQSIVAPLGLITQPNKYGQYKRGALSYAKNVVMRSPGVIGSMPDTRTYRASAANGTAWTTRQIRAFTSKLLVLFEGSAINEIRWITTGAPVVPAFPAGFGYELALAGAARFATQRLRYFYSKWASGASAGFKSVLASDSEGGNFRYSGLTPVAQVEFISFTTTDAGVVTPPFSVAYRALVKRTQDDGYVMVSAPSGPIEVYQATGSARDVIVYVQFALGHNYIPGDVLELYRTRTQTPETVSAGDTMFLATSAVLTATDLSANGFIGVRDTCPESGLGTELYSNPGQEGATAANYDPPPSTDMALFKGQMFYAAIAAPAKAVVGPRVAFGVLSTNSQRLFGIGYRTTTGTITSGSPIITVVNNIRGIAIGQYLYHANFAGGFATITGVTATTITVNSNATGTSAGDSITTADVIEATVPPSMVAPFKFTTPTELRIAASVLFMVGVPFVISSNIAQRIQSDSATVVDNQAGVEFIFQRPRATGVAFTLRASNGLNYSPALPDVNGGTAQSFADEIKENRYAWSKAEQPEAVPPLNYAYAGAGSILRMIPTRDALWIFCTDGLFRLSGDGGDGADAWRLDPADPNLFLSGRSAVATLKETIWCYSNRGLVSISDDAGIQDISLGMIGDLIPGANFTNTWDVFLECDQLHQEVWLTFRSGTLGAGSSTSYVFNTVTKSFVGPITNGEWSAMTWAPYLSSLVVAEVPAGSPAGNPNVLYFEDDTSTNRMAGVDVRFQPLYVDDPFQLKQFQTFELIWQAMNASATITPNYNGVASLPFPVNQSAGESRSTAGVPRRVAIAASLSPGFSMSDVVAAWSLRGVSSRFVDLGEETERD